MQTSFEYVRNFKAGRYCSVNLCYGMSQALIGDEHANALGYPKTSWRWLVPAVRPATWMVETARIYSSRVQELAKVAGPKAFRHLLSERGLKGRAGNFVIPRKLAVRGDKQQPNDPQQSATAVQNEIREGAK